MNKHLSIFGLLFFAQFVWALESGIKFTNYTEKLQPSKSRTLYFVHAPTLSFVNAIRACAARGGVLAEFKDEEDIQFLNGALNNGSMPGLLDTEYIYVGGIYVGPVEVDGKKGFQWFESGDKVSIWGAGNPNKLLDDWDEDCTVVYPIGGDWAIGDATCSQKFPFICASIKEQ